MNCPVFLDIEELDSDRSGQDGRVHILEHRRVAGEHLLELLICLGLADKRGVVDFFPIVDLIEQAHLGFKRHPVTHFIFQPDDDMDTVLPLQRIGLHQFVENESAECEGQRDKDGENRAHDHECVAAHIDEGFAEEV